MCDVEVVHHLKISPVLVGDHGCSGSRSNGDTDSNRHIYTYANNYSDDDPATGASSARLVFSGEHLERHNAPLVLL